MAKGGGGARVVHLLRHAERSRRLLLIRSLVDEVAKSPELAHPLPGPEDAWDLLARTEAVAPGVLDLVLAHPYTGSWAGYTTRLLGSQISGVWPLWVHVGYVHALAAAAAIRAGLPFTIPIPVWNGDAVLPTLGLARLRSAETWSVAEVTSRAGRIRVGAAELPADLNTTTGQWWSIRRLSAHGHGRTFSVRLDDVDPYRGPYEPLGPQRLDDTETSAWRKLMTDAWTLLSAGVPDFAEALRVGFDSVAPRPLSLFRTPSASSSDAFGSAIIGRPPDAASLASMLVHEFQHSRLAGLMHLTQLWEPDSRERIYAPWRDDPRPLGGVVQGLYAFFGMAAFWRSQAGTRGGAYEFAYHRRMSWQTFLTVQHDPALTPNGRRFLQAMGEELGPWQDEPLPQDVLDAAHRTALDHYLGWRIRHVRPDKALVRDLATAWLAGRVPDRLSFDANRPPTPLADGSWSHARADLTRLVMSKPAAEVRAMWADVPDVTTADFALATGRFGDAAAAYRSGLAQDPDQPALIAGLALALSATGPDAAARTLTRCPELVRAVHRQLRARALKPPTVTDLAAWIGRSVL